jgi:hypothetical protein
VFGSGETTVGPGCVVALALVPHPGFSSCAGWRPAAQRSEILLREELHLGLVAPLLREWVRPRMVRACLFFSFFSQHESRSVHGYEEPDARRLTSPL